MLHFALESTSSYRLYADRNRQAERRRSAGMADRHPEPYRRPQDQPYLRVPAVELERARRSSRT